ncbi:hypothetical protein AB0A98_32750 [Streptomyces chrestomyceticus]|uniref:hypothetical protein n=1 Tax=Streptomyces chrestomyceticus TaxID=68185 RepID=UPI003403AE95
MLTPAHVVSFARRAQFHASRAPQRPPVAFITRRTGEGPATAELELRSDDDGICVLSYADETFADRDSHGVLWRRHHQRHDDAGRPAGEPVAGRMHPGRLREAMSLLNCPIGACPAHLARDGWLFLVPRAQRYTEGQLTMWPPVCLAHIGAYACARPDLRHGYAAVRSAAPVPYGVRARRYRFADDAFEAVGVPVLVPYEQARGRWVVADRLVRRLTQLAAV